MSSSDEDVSGDHFSLNSAASFKIDWLDLSACGYPDSVGLSGLPGCKFKDNWRDIKRDLECIKLEDISDVFVLCTRGELTLYRVPTLLDEYSRHEIAVHHYPVPDGTAPTIDQLMAILYGIGATIEQGKRVLVHCFGGFGRTGVVAACLLLNLDDALTPEHALCKVQLLRGRRAIQTVKQYNFIYDFRGLRDEHAKSTSGQQVRPVSR
ncbi:cyclin-dependent kinase inhibitor 3-like [Ornithodoros turicata]|uniref:cyclin-dependent kinase inhibitor 3-like n=1 Tax=Ornithodoros turicata TaxID=34597 RepID=UPI003138DF39